MSENSQKTNSININSSNSNLTNSQSIENSPNEASKIKRKIRAWCSLCYQFFENGPTSKNCQDHLKKGNCNTVECKKGSPHCVRKFPNINSENRHTYCLKLEEVITWDPSLDIRQTLKNEDKNISVNLSLVNFANISCNKKEEKTDQTQKLGKEGETNVHKQHAFYSSLNESNVMKYDLNIDKKPEFFNSNESSVDKSFNNYINIFQSNDVDESFVNDFSKIYFYHEQKESVKENSHPSQHENIFTNNQTEEYFTEKKLNQTEIISTNSNNNNCQLFNSNAGFLKSTSMQNTNVNFLIKDETEIFDLLDKAQSEIKIPKTSIGKLKTAFKKKGLGLVKQLRFIKKKEGNWNFLYEDFKDVCSQMKGIAVYLEDLLEQIIN